MILYTPTGAGLLLQISVSLDSVHKDSKEDGFFVIHIWEKGSLQLLEQSTVWRESDSRQGLLDTPVLDEGPSTEVLGFLIGSFLSLLCPMHSFV